MVRALPNFTFVENLNELFPQLGWDPYEGMVAAFIPDIPNDAPNEEHLVTDGIACVYQGSIIDVVSRKPVKWWKLKNAARELQMSFPEPIWNGPASDFRVECLPDVPQSEGTILAIRRYACGPWLKIQEKQTDGPVSGVVGEGNSPNQEGNPDSNGAPNPVAEDASIG